MDERNENTIDLDNLNILQILKKINDEDKKVAYAVEGELNNIERATEIIVKGFKRGGRLFYVGSGTSGKLGIIDASECPPTFGVEDYMVQGIISGGAEAINGWLEETEDDVLLSVKDLEKKDLTSKDVVIGITASGNTPYVNSAIEYAKKIGCSTIGITCRGEGILNRICDIAICVEVGPEVIMGSTRMKAGTAQKMVLNMLSTASMIKMGNTYTNLMVNVKPINKKLKNRVKEIVKIVTGAEKSIIDRIVEETDYDAKTSIVSIISGMEVLDARKLLNENEGNVSKVLKLFQD